MRPQKPKRMTQTSMWLNWGGPPLGVQNLYTFPTPKTGIKQIEQFNMSPGLRKKAQDAVLKFLKFSVSIALTRAFEIFEVFEVFSLLCNLQDEPRFWDFEVFSSIALTRCLRFFCPTGTRDTIILLEGVPSRWPPRSGHHSPESS